MWSQEERCSSADDSRRRFMLDARDGATYLAVPLQTLRVDTITGFNLYRHNPAAKLPALPPGGPPLHRTPPHDAAGECGPAVVHHQRRSQLLLRYLEGNLAGIVATGGMSMAESSELVYGVAMHTVEEIFSQPTLPKRSSARRPSCGQPWRTSCAGPGRWPR